MYYKYSEIIRRYLCILTATKIIVLIGKRIIVIIKLLIKQVRNNIRKNIINSYYIYTFQTVIVYF